VNVEHNDPHLGDIFRRHQSVCSEAISFRVTTVALGTLECGSVLVLMLCIIVTLIHKAAPTPSGVLEYLQNKITRLPTTYAPPSLDCPYNKTHLFKMPATFRNYAGTESKSEAFHYSQSVKVGNIVKISGQGGWDSEGNIATYASKQVELALENVEKALQTVDKSLDWKNVYAIRSYHTNIDESADLCIEGWRGVMPNHRPVWTCVEITKLGIEGMQIEIEVEALAE
jgi:enamine deaminase RidA (YjgF/YER057c/UK114 family)